RGSRSALAVPSLAVVRPTRPTRRQGVRSKAGSAQSRQEPAVDCNRAHLVVTAEMDRIGPDQGLKAARRLLDPRGRLGEGDKSLRMEAETGELETIHREAIAWDIVPFGVGLQGRLARLLDRRWRSLFRIRGRGRPQ